MLIRGSVDFCCFLLAVYCSDGDRDEHGTLQKYQSDNKSVKKSTSTTKTPINPLSNEQRITRSIARTMATSYNLRSKPNNTATPSYRKYTRSSSPIKTNGSANKAKKRNMDAVEQGPLNAVTNSNNNTKKKKSDKPPVEVGTNSDTKCSENILSESSSENAQQFSIQTDCAQANNNTDRQSVIVESSEPFRNSPSEYNVTSSQVTNTERTTASVIFESQQLHTIPQDNTRVNPENLQQRMPLYPHARYLCQPTSQMHIRCPHDPIYTYPNMCSCTPSYGYYPYPYHNQPIQPIQSFQPYASTVIAETPYTTRYNTEQAQQSTPETGSTNSFDNTSGSRYDEQAAGSAVNNTCHTQEYAFAPNVQDNTRLKNQLSSIPRSSNEDINVDDESHQSITRDRMPGESTNTTRQIQTQDQETQTDKPSCYIEIRMNRGNNNTSRSDNNANPSEHPTEKSKYNDSYVISPCRATLCEICFYDENGTLTEQRIESGNINVRVIQEHPSEPNPNLMGNLVAPSKPIISDEHHEDEHVETVNNETVDTESLICKESFLESSDDNETCNVVQSHSKETSRNGNISPNN